MEKREIMVATPSGGGKLMSVTVAFEENDGILTLVCNETEEHNQE